MPLAIVVVVMMVRHRRVRHRLRSKLLCYSITWFARLSTRTAEDRFDPRGRQWGCIKEEPARAVCAPPRPAPNHRRSSDDVGRQLIFEKRYLVAQMQFALFQALDLQQVGARRRFKGGDCRVQVAMFLAESGKLGLEFGNLFDGHRSAQALGNCGQSRNQVGRICKPIAPANDRAILASATLPKFERFDATHNRLGQALMADFLCQAPI